MIFVSLVRKKLKFYIMRRLIFIGLFCSGMVFVSCGKSSCKECNGCKTLPSATLCEDDFEKTSDYNDQVQNYESDGCVCNNK